MRPSPDQFSVPEDQSEQTVIIICTYAAAETINLENAWKKIVSVPFCDGPEGGAALRLWSAGKHCRRPTHAGQIKERITKMFIKKSHRPRAWFRITHL